jgi:3-oxoacyl-[acyl-carrier protein] reductase
MIVVTGASRGLGKSICERLLESGEQVLGISRDVSKLKFLSIPCDVSSYDQVKKISQFIRQEQLSIKGLINAAGIASLNLALTTPAGVAEKIIQTNLLGTIYCCQQITPFMLRKKKGSVVNFSTIAVPLGLKGESIYVASKAGVEGFTRSFAREVSEFNVNVNCIAPGPINTDLLKGVTPEQISKIISQQIIVKQFDNTAVCDLVDFLLDDRSNSLSGQVLNIGGV